MPDLSIILNVHREAIYVRRTIHSLADAAARAEENGVQTELVIVFDRSDEATVTAVKSSPFYGFTAVRFVEVDHGSLGLARNSGISAAEGEYIWLADADDLVSANSIIAMYELASKQPRSVIFPEYLIAFGEAYWVARYYDDTVVTTADFAFGHPYISRIFTHKKNLDGLSYKDLRLSTGYAYEDWHFNCELRARGLSFRIAPQTLFFYRQRKGSLLKQANAISVGQIPHSTLFDPETFPVRVRQEEVDSSASERAARRDVIRCENHRAALFDDPVCREMLAAAIRIDPGINIYLIKTTSEGWSNVFPNQHWGHDYAQVCELVAGRPFTDIVLFPTLRVGGGEKYIIDVLCALAEQDRAYRGLVITGEATDNHEWIERLPPGTTFLDIFNIFPWLDETARDLLLLRLIAAVGQNSRLHLKASPFAHRWFGRFSTVMGRHCQAAYYRFCDEQVWIDGISIEIGWGFEFISTEVSNIASIVTDHQKIVDDDRNRIGVFQDRWKCLYAPHNPIQHISRPTPSFRILWASRISKQKLPELLPCIVRAVCEVLPRVNFVAAGDCDPGMEACVEKLRSTPGLEYRGGYNRFDTLEPLSFDALLYTSTFDGLPNIILEAMGHGLPVIAPDVGGIAEAVQTGKTGWLIPQESDEDLLVQLYVDAVVALYRDWDFARRMGEAGREMVSVRHSTVRHRQQVREIFLSNEG